jgi:hypothetical protein
VSDDQGGGGGGRGWFAGIGRGNFQIQGLDQAVAQISALNSTLGTLTTTLQNFSQNQQRLASGASQVFSQISSSANQATQAVNATNSAYQGMQTTVANTRTGSGVVNALFSTASAVAGSDLMKDIAMFPLRFMTQTVGQNRQLGMNLSAQLGGQMYATGGNVAQIAGTLSRFPGNVLGSPEDLIGLLQVARQAGAMIDFPRIGAMQGRGGGAGQQDQFGARTVGFLQAIEQAQRMTPAVPAPALAQMIGGYSANVGAQQQSAFLTGGAFSMIAAGGRHRNIQEWAESILRWLEGQRPGGDHGKPFTYGQLLAQYFPGSNIDAWLTANGVPEGMKEYWWNYALAKSRTVGTTQGAFQIEPINLQAEQGGNQAWERLQAVSAQTRGQFRLTGQMAGTYANKEQANRWWNEMMAEVTGDLIPKQISQGAMQALQYLPDAMEELLFSFLERSGPLGALIGGGLGYGITGIESLANNLMGFISQGIPSTVLSPASLQSIQDLFKGAFRLGGGIPDMLAQAKEALTGGDVGDAEWGSRGTTTTSGMNQDFRRKLNKMMRANPRLQITSGLRDTVQQQNLRSKGNNGVSGKPSAHTRGRAADLGPSSEYPWLVANARRFGLASGNRFGEPWHVGMAGDMPHGDVGDIDMGASLGALFGLLTGTLDKPDVIEGIGSLVPGVMNLFFGLFGAGSDANLANLKYDPALYMSLRDAGVYKTGGKYGGTSYSYGSSIFGGAGGLVYATQAEREAAAAGGLVYSTGTERGEVSRTGAKTLEGALQALGIRVPASRHAGEMVAHLAFAAGFRGEALKKVVGLSKRESGWDPTAFNPDAGTRDLSYGLMQINMLGNLGPARRQAYGITKNEELFDPLVNLRAAFKLSSGGTSFYHWGGYRGRDDFYNTDMNEAAQIVKNAGYGDIPEILDFYLQMRRDESETEQARRVARASGQPYGDVPEIFNAATFSTQQPASSPRMPSSLSVSAPRTSSQQIVFNNSFVIQAGGGANTGMPQGLDVRRTVGVIADQLEAEMKKRLVRTN